MDDVSELFDKVGIRYTIEETDCGRLINSGNYTCSSSLPDIAFASGGDNNQSMSFTSLAQLSSIDDGTGICWVGIYGEDFSREPFWTLGLPFFNGRYIDFNGENDTIGFATLKDGVLPAVN